MASPTHSRSHVVPVALPLAASAEPPPAYSHFIDRTRSSLQARLADAPAGDVLRPYFERGKMLRALLVFAASASVGGRLEQVQMAAEAIELLHGASLFHDDIVDGASQRRGLASLHERLGVGPALVVGDDLLLRAFAVLAEARACHPAARVLEVTETLNKLARECCRGQFEELCAARDISEEQYLAIVRQKTAAPFVAAGVLGVVLGGGNASQVARIRAYGEGIGIAFQISDDLLDLTGEASRLGKPVGNSLAQGRPLLPLIYLWQAADGPVHEQLAELSTRDYPRQELVTLLERHGIFNRVRQVQQQYLDAALAAADDLPVAAGVDALRALAVTALSFT